jgi:hypothetical protein
VRWAGYFGTVVICRRLDEMSVVDFILRQTFADES